MGSYDIFFCASLFFITGVFLASLGIKFLILKLFFALLIFIVIFLILSKFVNFIKNLNIQRSALIFIAALSPCILFGALFYNYDFSKFIKNQNIVFDKELIFNGRVADNPQFKNIQEFKIELTKPLKGKILIKTSLLPQFHYGDKIQLKARIKRPFKFQLLKERIGGIADFPEIKLAEKTKPSLWLFLFGLRKNALLVFKKVLPYEESAFLSGIVFGSREDFSDELKDAMSKSGTTHLVALSGYNITIIISVVTSFLILFFRKKTALLFAFILIFGFVFMTGAESSIVRAAIMGILVSIAPLFGRIYAPRNSIIFAALLMTLANPNTLAYDIGFQLSFLAILGIIYLRPALQKLLRFSGSKSFCLWRENLLSTLSAQIMTAPILITQFGIISFGSLVSNIIILSLIPATMFLGFLILSVSLLSQILSSIIGWLTWILLKFEIFLIHLFSKLSFSLHFNINMFVIISYYCLLGFLIFKLTKFKSAYG